MNGRQFLKRVKDITDSGFSSKANDQGSVLFDKQGNYNLVKRGIPFLDQFSIYQMLVRLPTWKFVLVVVLIYLLVNLFFAALYVWNGIQCLNGAVTGNKFEEFIEAFYFSSQTFTTVGYGRVNPIGFLANFIASIEAMLGLFAFALGTGLLYGRFARPVYKFVFSKYMLVSPFKEGRALMVRFANAKNSTLIEGEARMIFTLVNDENNNAVRRYYTLPLQLDKVSFLALSWTLVHVIDQDSPLYGMTQEELTQREAEITIMIRAVETTTNQVISHRHSWRYDTMIWGAKFPVIFNRTEDGTRTEIHLDRISDYEPAPLVDMVSNPNFVI